MQEERIEHAVAEKPGEVERRPLFRLLRHPEWRQAKDGRRGGLRVYSDFHSALLFSPLYINVHHSFLARPSRSTLDRVRLALGSLWTSVQPARTQTLERLSHVYARPEPDPGLRTRNARCPPTLDMVIGKDRIHVLFVLPG